MEDTSSRAGTLPSAARSTVIRTSQLSPSRGLSGSDGYLNHSTGGLGGGSLIDDFEEEEVYFGCMAFEIDNAGAEEAEKAAEILRQVLLDSCEQSATHILLVPVGESFAIQFMVAGKLVEHSRLDQYLGWLIVECLLQAASHPPNSIGLLSGQISMHGTSLLTTIFIPNEEEESLIVIRTNETADGMALDSGARAVVEALLNLASLELKKKPTKYSKQVVGELQSCFSV